MRSTQDLLPLLVLGLVTQVPGLVGECRETLERLGRR